MGDKTQVGTGVGCAIVIAVVVLVAYLSFQEKASSPTTTPKKEIEQPTDKSSDQQEAARDTITIVTVENRTRLCPRPDCGEGGEISRIPTGTKLEVEGKQRVHYPQWDVIWYKVTYAGKTGWVSEFNTDKAPPQPRFH